MQTRDTHRSPISATGAFATIILERLLDLVTVLMLLALYVFVFDRRLALTNPQAIVWLKWIGAMAGVGALTALGVLFVLAGDPERLRRTLERLAHVVPSTLAGLVARDRREVRARPRRDSPPGPAARRAALVVPAVAVDCRRHLGGGGGVPDCHAVLRIVSHHRPAVDRRH